MSLTLEQINGGLDPSDPRLLNFVDYLAANGVALLPSSGKVRHWVVSQPEGESSCEVSIRSFPASASASQMKDALGMINLAYSLNSAAHIAMSRLIGYDYALPDDKEGMTLQQKLDDLFENYRP